MGADSQPSDVVADLIPEDFAGWSRGPDREGFNQLVGPFYYQADGNTNFKLAFKAEKRHLNGGGSVHGGCLMTLADTALFVISRPYLEGGAAVTLQMDSQFLSPGREGDIIVASGEVTRAGASVVFVRGQLTCGERVILTFTGIMKRMKATTREREAKAQG